MGCILVVLLAVIPAQAFTAKTLTITLNGNGDAQADMQYDLSFVEQAAIFFHAADPSAELQNALQNNLQPAGHGRQCRYVIGRCDHPLLCHGYSVPGVQLS